MNYRKDYCLVFFRVVLQSLIFTIVSPLRGFQSVLISMDSWWSLGSVSLRIRAVFIIIDFRYLVSLHSSSR